MTGGVRISPTVLATQVAELRAAFQGREVATVEEGLDMPVVRAPRGQLVAVLRELRDRFRFAHCSAVTAVDRLPAEPRFQVVYALYSLADNRWVRVKTECPEDDPVVPTATSLWPGANWHEREVYDMFGIRFDGHPDLRRLLLPEGYLHHPLRKDFPREGIEPDRLYREWDAERRRPEEAA